MGGLLCVRSMIKTTPTTPDTQLMSIPVRARPLQAVPPILDLAGIPPRVLLVDLRCLSVVRDRRVRDFLAAPIALPTLLQFHAHAHIAGAVPAWKPRKITVNRGLPQRKGKISGDTYFTG